MKDFTIEAIQKAYATKQFSPVELTEYYLNRIDEEEHLHAYISVAAEKAMEQAKISEQKMMAGLPMGKLEGVPISYKDNIHVTGMPATSGSRIDEDFMPKKDAWIVQQLNGKGAINIGKTNMHEFAFGITSDNPFYGSVRNPWKESHSAGGSSGGSGVAVAADLSAASIGTDTGGSIRIPAAYCGVVGFKPTSTRLDSSGLTNISWTLDHVGPLTKSVSDMAIMMEALTNESYKDSLVEDIRGIRIGVPSNYFLERTEPIVLEIFQVTLERLQQLGAVLIDIEIPFEADDINLNHIIARSEAGTLHRSNIEHHLEEYGKDVRLTLESSHELAAYQYIEALQKKERVTEAFTTVFSNIDALITPTSAVMPQEIGKNIVTIDGEVEDLFSAATRLPAVFNITGHPALSIPTGDLSNGIPIGIQFVGAHFQEQKLLKIAYAYEQAYVEAFYKKRREALLLSQVE